ncbi:tetratricopeptide repeat protein [Azospirillum halopraeferens]|uniref:tetratricopeptide repeat protein n=1 Tax=Azospirillum halopraeferens TaxID=34010 RepID=UPI00041AF3FD|nr:tetratricopeptide repeat protein [Azospirillum halopraeferens]
METIDQTLAVATEHHKAGRTAEAERLYREVLDRSPGHPDALHLLGVLSLQAGRPAEAADLIARAVAADAESPVFHSNLGHALHALGRPRDAAESFARALVLVCNSGDNPGNSINSLSALIQRYDPDSRRAAADIVSRDYALGDVMRRLSLPFYLTGDIRYYRELVRAILAEPARFTVPSLHYAYWGISMQVFVGAARSGPLAEFVADELARLYDLLVDETALRYATAARMRPAGPRPQVRRVALITNQMLGAGHQPTLDAFDYARRLQDECGVEVLIVNANTMAATPENGFIPAFSYNVTEAYSGVQMIEAYGARVRMASFPHLRFDEEKVHAIIDHVEGFDPDAIVAFGGSNIIADLFADTRAVVLLPTSSGVPNSHADLVLGYDAADRPDGWPAELAARFRPHAFGWTPPPEDAVLSRGELGLPDTGALFVVVGNRLDAEVDDAFLALVDGLLDRLPDAVVAFAGEVTTLPGRLAGLRNAGRARSLGHVEAIRALYRIATALLNPRRQGGGGSAAFALAEGLPVVTPAAGDVARVAGPDFTVADDAALLDRARALATDPALHAAQAAAARDRFAAVGDRRRSAEQLLAYCREAAAAG